MLRWKLSNTKERILVSIAYVSIFLQFPIHYFFGHYPIIKFFWEYSLFTLISGVSLVILYHTGSQLRRNYLYFWADYFGYYLILNSLFLDTIHFSDSISTFLKNNFFVFIISTLGLCYFIIYLKYRYRDILTFWNPNKSQFYFYKAVRKGCIGDFSAVKSYTLRAHRHIEENRFIIWLQDLAQKSDDNLITKELSIEAFKAIRAHCVDAPSSLNKLLTIQSKLPLTHPIIEHYCSAALAHNYRFKDAITHFDKIIELEPNESFNYSCRAYNYMQLEDYKTAYNDLTKAIQLNSCDFLSYSNRSTCSRNLGNYQSALNDLNIVKKLQTTDAQHHYCRAKIHIEFKQYKKAIEEAQIALKLDPEFYYVHQFMGYVLCNYGDSPKESLKFFDQAIKLKKDDYYTYIYRGYAYGELDQADNALSDYDKAIQIDPNIAMAYQYRGNVHRNGFKYEEAIKDFNKCIELDGDFHVYFLKGLACEETNQNTEAIKCYNEYLKHIDQNDEDFKETKERLEKLTK